MLLRRWLIAVLLMAGMAMPLQAEESWQINLKDADIEAFISQVADITGRSFVLDPRVKGKVSVLSSEPMNQEGVYELFLSVLQIHGLAAVPAGDVTLVIQQKLFEYRDARWQGPPSLPYEPRLEPGWPDRYPARQSFRENICF